MKYVLLICILFFVLAITVNAQNGGQSPENNVAKISKLSNTETTMLIQVTNKQPCNADYLISYGSQINNVVYTIPGNSNILVNIIINGNTKFKVKAITACVSGPDKGWIEFEPMEYLPVKFGIIKIKVVTLK